MPCEEDPFRVLPFYPLPLMADPGCLLILPVTNYLLYKILNWLLKPARITMKALE